MATMEWEEHKVEIQHLYLEEDMKLLELMQHMTENRGFKKTKSQYERQLKKWKFQKKEYLPRGFDWDFVGKRVEKRKRLQGKESELFVNGELYPPEKLRKALYGKKAFVSKTHNFSGIPSPKTPEGIELRTPSSLITHSFAETWLTNPRLTWNESLPWLRFQGSCNGVKINYLSHAAKSLLLQRISHQSHTEKTELIRHLRMVVPCSNLGYNDANSQINASLTILMPEEHEGQHQALTTNSLSVGLYLLSNNLQWPHTAVRTTESMLSQDERVIGLLRSLRWDNAIQLKELVESQHPTANAVAEKVFASAIRLLDLDLVEMLLNAGLDPNCPIEGTGSSCTPLEWAADTPNDEGLKLVELLLSYLADVNSRRGDLSALVYAAHHNNTRAIAILLRFGAVAQIEVLVRAARMVAVDQFKLLLNSSSEVDWLYYVENHNLGSGYTTILGAAATARRPEIVKVILESYPEVSEDPKGQADYISPIALAVNEDCLEVVEILIEAGLDVELADRGKQTLLELAASNTNLDICKVLLENGATIDRPLTEQKQPMSALSIAVTRDFTELVNLLFEQDARLDDEYSQHPGSVLGGAIEVGNLTTIRLLQDAGAAFTGPRIRRIANKETAQYLDKRGTLGDILNTCGPTILSNALYDEQLELAQWLIDRNGDIVHADPEAEMSPLGAAAAMELSSMMETILGHGAKVTDRELTEVVDAIQSGEAHVDVLQRLLVNFEGHAPRAVALAGSWNSIDLVRLLLQGGVHPTGALINDSDEWTYRDEEYAAMGSSNRVHKPQSALELAAKGHSVLTLNLIFQSYNWSPNLVGRALAVAVAAGAEQAIDVLFKQEPSLNEEVTWYVKYNPEDKLGPDDLETLTAIQVAVRDQRVSIVRKLLQNPDVDINYPAKGSRGRTALQHAVENGNTELMAMLLACGADVNGSPAERRGATALQLAAMKGYLGIARKLISLGANINAPAAAYEGRTALAGAAEHGRLDMLQLLLDEGALVVGEDGESQYEEAIRLARKRGHYVAARLLESFKRTADPAYFGA
ncbi:ankyrin repeat-containing domain protein [Aspergillus carlsbadensis]|nr:ankyrin repeat-containing domain protein [Aspergillus carlsbadensis]